MKLYEGRAYARFRMNAYFIRQENVRAVLILEAGQFYLSRYNLLCPSIFLKIGISYVFGFVFI